MNHKEQVILVDEHDHEIGTEEKLAAHRLGKLHRAFSVFIFHPTTKELLLQQRQFDKYHCGGLWTNTCCSHPHPGENIIAAAERRLAEEMGIQTSLRTVGAFQYTAHFDNGLIENEYDHVLIGFSTTKQVNFDKKEVAATRWITVVDLNTELKLHPEKFTPWFSAALTLATKRLGDAL
jgi:diphosphomevalonate decarboxylase